MTQVRMTTTALMMVAGLCAGGAWAQQDGVQEEVAAQPAEPQIWLEDGPDVTLLPAPAANPRIEVVFVLDTTGSMGGLIEGAKAKIWSIANQIVLAEPRPDVSIGLVGYRDITDSYITKLTPLTVDLDTIYADLMEFEAAGGGDGPESVNQALNEAITQFAWSEDEDVLRLVYLVGDAPPHMDYEQDVKYPETCELAAKRGIIINSIQCGQNSQTMSIWQEIARLAEGEFIQVEQSGGMAVVETPFDEDLARLDREMDETLVAYGSVEAQTALADKREASARFGAVGAAPSALAERATYRATEAGGASLLGRQELVSDLADGKVDLAELEEDQLPENMQAMSMPERQAFVDAQAERRLALREQILSLSEKRAKFVKAELARLGEGSRSSFDSKILETLRSQAARVGLTYAEQSPEGPAGDEDPE